MTMAAMRGDYSDSLFATPAIVVERRADGSTIVRSTVPLKPAARKPRKIRYGAAPAQSSRQSPTPRAAGISGTVDQTMVEP